jgi:4-carboxymuconolactone decarboxylase
MPAKKLSPPRLPAIPDDELTSEQRALIDAIRSGPRGRATEMRGPFAVFLHAPAYGELAQRLGGFCRLKTQVPPRLSEFAILLTAKRWRAQYEWHAHVPHAERAGVTPQTIKALHAGRAPKSAPADERIVHDFVKELYGRKRVSDKTYARLHAVLGDQGIIELVGILGYYAMIAMLLDAFRMPVPPGAPIPFAEPR